MKKRANILTRIALALTVFTTTMAGVAPMTARAEATAPTLTDEATFYTSEFKVTITVPTNNTVVYTTNGTAPSAEQTDPAAITETKEITITGDTTVKAASYETSDTTKKLTTAVEKKYTKGTINAPTFSAGATANVTPGQTITVTPPSTPSGTSVKFNMSDPNGTAAKPTISGSSSGTTTITIPATASIGSKYQVNAIAYKDDTESAEAVANYTVVAPSLTVSNYTATPASFTKGSTTDVKFNLTLSGSALSTNLTSVSYNNKNVSGATFSRNSDVITVTVPASVFEAESVGAHGISFTLDTVATPYVQSYSVVAAADPDGTYEGVYAFADTTNDNFRDFYGNNPSIDGTGTNRAYAFTKVKEFNNGTSLADIKAALPKEVRIKVAGNTSNDTTRILTWEDVSNNTYKTATKTEQTFNMFATFTLASDIDNPNSLPIKVRVPIKVLSEDDSKNTNTGTVKITSFTPENSAYIYPGANLSATADSTDGVTIYMTNDNNKVTTSSPKSPIKIPEQGNYTSSSYKLNAAAYKDGKMGPESSVTYTVVTNKDDRYKITDGSGQTIGKSSTVPPQFIGSGDLSKFKGLWVDNVFVKESGSTYAKASGSTVIAFYPAYLQTLNNGEHSIVMVYEDGYATGTFTLTAGDGSSGATANITDQINNGNSTANLPGSRGGNTDDRSNLVIMFVILGMLIAGFSGAVYFKNEKLRRNRYMD